MNRKIILLLLVLVFTVLTSGNAIGAEMDYEVASNKTQLNYDDEYYGVPVKFRKNPYYPGDIITELYVYREGSDYIFTILYSNGEIGTTVNGKIKTSFFNPPKGDILMISWLDNSELIVSDNQKIQYRVDVDWIESVSDSITIFLFDKTIDDNVVKNRCSLFFNIGNLNSNKIPVSIEFTDEYLSQAIKEKLNNKGKIFTSDLLKIEDLDLSDKGIKNLNGIEYLKNIKILNISNNKITDISKINNLEKLEKLYIQGNPIQDYFLDSSIISKLIDYDFELDYQRAVYANQLKEIGVFKGTSNGFELYREPTRIEALIMLIRLLGKEAEALQTDTTISVFNDVPSWAVPYANYAYYNGLTKGIGNNKFGSSDVIDAKSYVTFLLRALGYSDSAGDFKWNDAIFYAQSVQLYDNSMQVELNNTKFLRAHVAELSYKTLAAKMKGSNLTLIQKLVDDNVINKELAEKLQF